VHLNVKLAHNYQIIVQLVIQMEHLNFYNMIRKKISQHVKIDVLLGTTTNKMSTDVINVNFIYIKILILIFSLIIQR
jgi:hypothetical protein